MIRLCLLGNSHVAALVLAWQDGLVERSDLAPVFQGQHQRTWATSVVENRTIRCDSPGGRAIVIEPDLYDAFAIVGCGFGPPAIIEGVYRDYHMRDLQSRRGQALSRGDFLAASYQALGKSPGMHLANLVHSLTKLPLFLIPNPLPNERGFSDREKGRMRAWRDCAANNDAARMIGIYDAFCEELRDRDIVVIQQPEETKASSISSRVEFMEGALRVRDKTERRPDDYLHANTRYGILLWDQIREQLSNWEGVPQRA